mmetsp:Transcript_21923/g.60963  ORF Transcript_21923/g.60963 Transcript_21923/m.60963 type:complete len:852 (+) Transcript_21923:160-2715(+)
MTAPNIDRKLAHLVKKMVNPNDSCPPNPDYIVTILRTQHREYQRKNMDDLRKQVVVAVDHVLANTSSSSGQQEESPARSNKKRSADQKREMAYEAAVSEQESSREAAGVGGGLNASLRKNYKQKQDKNEATATTDKPTAKKRRRAVPKSPAMLAASGSFGGDGGEAPAFLTPVPRPVERYADLGGMDTTVQEIRQLVEYPLLRPELYRHLGIDPPRGVLLRGPPGTGKSHLANAVAGELGVNYFRVSAPELVSGMSGESEGRIRDLFKSASDAAPSVIFLDEIDAVAPKRNEAGSTRGMEKRMVAQLLTSMDSISPDKNRNMAAVIVLAATNRADSLDSALRRAGRFDREILLGVPDEEAREKILRAMTASMRLAGDFDFKVLARKTPGFVGADVRSLSKEAAVLAINRIFRDVLVDQVKSQEAGEQPMVDSKSKSSLAPLTADEMEPLFVTMSDFLQAIPSVQPSSKREGFATVPDVSWDNIGALQTIREELTISVLEPIRHPEKFQALGLTLPAGVLLYGPPGCGKTLLAKAIANESGANFISVKGPELLDKYVGESERAVRLVFERARASSPCVVFFDELDSLVPRRGMDSGGGGVSERVVNQLLTEMDGLDSRRSVFVIAATNRPELIDPAMMRPGRLDKLLYVPLPEAADRISILKALGAKVKLGDDVNIEKIAGSQRANGYSGADCAALLREAGLAVIKEHALSDDDDGKKVEMCIHSRHFDEAFRAVMPSVSKKDQKRYDRIRDRMASARTRSVAENDSDEPDTTSTTKRDETNVGRPGNGIIEKQSPTSLEAVKPTVGGELDRKRDVTNDEQNQEGSGTQTVLKDETANNDKSAKETETEKNE